jgi:hypothetical protein
MLVLLSVGVHVVAFGGYAFVFQRVFAVRSAMLSVSL